MRHILLVTLLFTAMNAHAQTPDSIWMKQFKALRDAIYQRNKEAVKQYFDFPLPHQFWHTTLVDRESYDSGMVQQMVKWGSQELKVSDQLFTLYFDQFFNHKFIKCLLKIKTKDLFEKGFSRTENYAGEMYAGEVWYYQLVVQFNREKQYIRIAMYEENDAALHPETDEYGVPLKTALGGSSDLIFQILDGQLKFISISLAG